MTCVPSLVSIVLLKLCRYSHVSHPNSHKMASECQPLAVYSLLPPSKHTMHTFSQIITFLKAYLGDSLSRLVALLYGGNKTVTAGELPSHAVPAAPDQDLTVSAKPEPEPEDPKITGDDLIRAAVDLDLDALPSLPSLFKFPEARAPVDIPASTLCKQDFGAPSNLYYDRRPFGDVTNFKQFEQAKGMKINTQVKPLKSKPAARGRRKVTRLAPVTARPLVEDPAPPVVKFSASAEPACVKHSVSAESATQPCTTTRPSLPTARSVPIVKLAPVARVATQAAAHSLPAPRPIPVPAPVDEPWRRYSVPILVQPPRLNLADRLSALFKEAKDTIDALNDVALEEGRVFVIGEDDDDEGPVSSISASRSMAALASTSTRSLNDLLESYNAVMTGPTWRRLLARSDDISRRNDSIV
ncbi:hypothetical protein C8R45DRAFT_1065592 [Mycena sanguinolenta]|nr:hypothetical protein C8R45DRAFT_1065592 [Mycena sanguinolenta]